MAAGTTLAAGAPAAPTALTAQETGPQPVYLLWNDQSADETAFLLERRPAAGGDWAMVAELPANLVGHTDDDAPNLAVVYQYRLRARNAGGDSAYSNTAATASLNPFQVWRREFFDAAGLADLLRSSGTADPDGDGLPNALEYAFGRDPLVRDRNGLEVATGVDAEGRPTFTFTQRIGATALTYAVESGAEVGALAAVPGLVLAGPPVPTGDSLTVRLLAPMEGADRVFYRLRVDLP